MNALPVPFYGQGHAHLPVHSPEGLLDESAREKLAEEITRIHCDAAGIPRSYVNVMFTDMPAGRYFVPIPGSRRAPPAENAMEGGSVFPEISQE
jgi:phenylpyruvate tautomerase PptA (4-oxalocrotonate tautomerase family)